MPIKQLTNKGTSPFVAKVTFPSENFPSVPKSFWKGWVEVIPPDLIEKIKDNTQFKKCFQ